MTHDASAAATQRLNTLIQAGVAAVNGGDLGAAESAFREALTLAPDNPSLLHDLAVTLVRANRRDEAEKILLHVASRGALPVSLMLLAEIFESSKREDHAVRCYEIVLKAKPGDYNALMKLGALKDRMGDKPAARDCYGRAVAARPNDIDATEKYTSAIWAKDPATALKLTEDLLQNVGGDLAARARVLNSLITQKEWGERIRRGQMPYHASRLDELFFNYAAEYVKDFEATNRARLAANPSDASAVLALATARFCLRDRHGAERLYESIKPKQHIIENIRFGAEFYDGLRTLSEADLVRNLPPILSLTPMTPNPRGILYLSCNFTYFSAFALPMLVSLRERSPGTQVHLHVMDAGPADAAFILRFMDALAPLAYAASIERPGLQNAPAKQARCYYHAVRFIRLYEHMELYRSPLWLMDVDAVVNRDLTGLFATLHDRDVAMRIRPGRMEPWNQFNACVVGAGTSEASRRYFRLVAAYVAHFHQAGALRWGIDQLAMYGVFADMQDRAEAPQLALLDSRDVDYDYQDDGFVWCNSGAGKFQHLARVRDPAAQPFADFESNRFVEIFEQHWAATQRISAQLNGKAPA